MTLDSAVYTAIIGELERLERTRAYSGNAHHLAQKLAALVVGGNAVCLVSDRDETYEEIIRTLHDERDEALRKCGEVKDRATLYAKDAENVRRQRDEARAQLEREKASFDQEYAKLYDARVADYALTKRLERERDTLRAENEKLRRTVEMWREDQRDDHARLEKAETENADLKRRLASADELLETYRAPLTIFQVSTTNERKSADE